MINPDTDNRGVLLIGDISSVFPDVGGIAEKSCEIQTNMLDAIDAAARKSFAAVGVVMAGSSSKLTSVLKALREVACDAKIVLLAQMYEEPAAIQLVGTASNGTYLADEYLICPVEINRFYEFIGLAHGSRGVDVARPAVLDKAVETKIKHLERLATEDDLTALKNRRYIWEFGRQIIEYARGRNGRVTLLVFDIDNFKHYNDVYGHGAGDEVLRQAAVLMRRCCRSHDVVGRIGGDEFAVIFWDVPRARPLGAEAERRSALAEHPKEAIFIAKRFVRELEKAESNLLGPEGRGILTISGGLASFPRDGSAIQELLGQADKALLDAKHSGKNRIYLVGRPQNDIAGID